MYNNKRDDKKFQVSIVNILPLILNFQAFVLIIIIKLPNFDPKIQISPKIIQENTLNNHYDWTKP